MGTCYTAGTTSEKQTSNQMKYALIKFSSNVKTQIQQIQNKHQFQSKLIALIQSLKRILTFLNQQIGNFFNIYKQNIPKQFSSALDLITKQLDTIKTLYYDIYGKNEEIIHFNQSGKKIKTVMEGVNKNQNNINNQFQNKKQQQYVNQINRLTQNISFWIKQTQQAKRQLSNIKPSPKKQTRSKQIDQLYEKVSQCERLENQVKQYKQLIKKYQYNQSFFTQQIRRKQLQWMRQRDDILVNFNQITFQLGLSKSQFQALKNEQQKLKKQQNQRKNKQNQLKNKQNQIKKQQNQIKNKQNQLKNKQNQIKNKQNQLKNKQNQIKKQQNQIKRIQNQQINNKNNEDLLQLKDKLINLTKQKGQKQIQLQKQIQRLKLKIEQLQNKLKQAKQIQNQLQSINKRKLNQTPKQTPKQAPTINTATPIAVQQQKFVFDFNYEQYENIKNQLERKLQQREQQILQIRKELQRQKQKNNLNNINNNNKNNDNNNSSTNQTLIQNDYSNINILNMTRLEQSNKQSSNIINNLKQQINKLKYEISALKQLKQEYQMKIKEIKQQNNKRINQLKQQYQKRIKQKTQQRQFITSSFNSNNNSVKQIQINNKQRQLENKQRQLTNKQKQLEIKNNQLIQSQQQLRINKQQLKNSQQQLKINKQQLRKDKQKLQLNGQDIQFDRIQIRGKQQKLTILQKQLTNKQKQLVNKQQSISNNISNIKQIEQQLNQYKQQIKSNQQLIIRLNKQIQQLRQNINKINQQNNLLSSQSNQSNQSNLNKIQQLHTNINNITQQLQYNKQQLIKYKHNYQTQIINSQQLNNKINLLQSQLININKINQSTQNIIKDKQSLQIQLNNLKHNNQILQQQQQKLLQQLNLFKINYQQQNNQIHTINLQYQNKCQEFDQLKLSLKNNARCYTQYFNGHIININKNQHTQWFVDTIEKYMGKQIKLTYPLYRFDLSNQNSFHNYIDFKPNIVMVCKMTNGQIIAGFSQPGFKPQTNVDYKEGLMFGFKNRKVFNVKAKPSSKANRTNPKPITYDEYFIIWGNSDIRIKSGTKQLYSNYSTGNCSYEDKGNPNPSVNDLFLQPERDAVVEDFEFYQIEFDDERFG